MTVVLPIPNLKQNHRSANCGPCTLKMAMDYYYVRNADGEPYSLLAINRLLRVTHEFGCEKQDFRRVLKRIGLKFRKIRFDEIEDCINSQIPIIALYFDEDETGHYSLVVGYSKTDLILNDPWNRCKTRYEKTVFRNMLKPYGDWLVAVIGEPQNHRQSPRLS